MARRTLAVAAALASLAVIAPAIAPAAGTDHPVSFPTTPGSGPYTPSTLEVPNGDTVTFSGNFADHPLAWNDGDFATQNSGTSHTYTFAKAGLFRFHCTIHSSMTGSVHVPGNAFATPDFTISPSPAQPGATVTLTATNFTDPDGTIVSYEWDLDGNGTFETTTTSPTASRSYPTEQTVHVALRYVDDGHETSPATTHDLLVSRSAPAAGSPSPAPAPASGAGSGTPAGSGAPGAPSPAAGQVTGAGTAPAGAPTPSVRVLSRALAFHGGVASVAVRVAAPAAVTATLRSGGVVLARGRARLTRGNRQMLRLRLTAAGARRLRRAHALQATLAVTVGTATQTRSLRVRGS